MSVWDDGKGLSERAQTKAYQEGQAVAAKESLDSIVDLGLNPYELIGVENENWSLGYIHGRTAARVRALQMRVLHENQRLIDILLIRNMRGGEDAT